MRRAVDLFNVLRSRNTSNLRGNRGRVKEFSGHRFILLSVEHNFRNTPLLMTGIPFLYKSGIELIVHGTAACTWASSPLPFGLTTNGWHTEAGFGISRILGLFRLDYTYRFTKPRNSFVSLGVAQIL